MSDTPVLFTQTWGRAPRKALALHCSLAHSGAWRPMAAALAEPLAFTAADLPGHGRSPGWDGQGDYTLKAAKGAEALVGEGPVDLIGHSGGGVTALLAALARPEAVRTLTLVEPVLFAAAKGFPEYDAFRAEMAPWAAAWAAGDIEAATRAFTDLWGTGEPWDELTPDRRAYMTDRIGLIAAGMPALNEDSGGILADGRLETLEMPVMILAGGNSPVVVHRIAEELAARLPDVGLAEVPGAAHMLPLTHAKEVAGLVDVNLTRE